MFPLTIAYTGESVFILARLWEGLHRAGTNRQTDLPRMETQAATKQRVLPQDDARMPILGLECHEN
jgi:hypothetical protein